MFSKYTQLIVTEQTAKSAVKIITCYSTYAKDKKRINPVGFFRQKAAISSVVFSAHPQFPRANAQLLKRVLQGRVATRI